MLVYADVLVAINYIINFLLLLCSEKLSGIPQKRRNTMLAAALGGAASLAIFLPPLPFMVELLAKLLLALLMVAVAYRGMHLKGLFKLWLIFFTVSFLFAGAMLALWLLLGGGVLTYYNGIVYLNIPPLVLIATTAAAYLAVEAFNRLFAPGGAKEALYRVQAEKNGAVAVFTALEDTGNRLYEPFSGLPVLVCSYQAIEKLIPAHQRQWFLTSQDPQEMPPGCRLIAYSTVGKKGMLGAFKADRLVVTRPDGTKTECMAYLAVSGQLSKSYGALLNPQILKLKI